ncbi:GNAT family N-acetyltransferase [Roseobacter sp.]|uniref:GNAT family N-acetyltransferase n=1 Tax=Roseobacter sp. TaxID=1907202 RepID=UPI003298B4C3
MAFIIAATDPNTPDVAALLTRHLELMQDQSPPESCHALPLDAFSDPDVTVFTLREADTLLAVGALRMDAGWGELKSMHTAQSARGRGAARALLDVLINVARDANLTRLYLETGSGPEHMAARRLYASAGFSACAPFGDYLPDPLSYFMTRAI